MIIREPLEELVVSINDSVNATCNSFCDAKALATYSGGTGVITVDWYTAENQTSDTAYNLCAGIHFVEVEDENGCKNTDQVNIQSPIL